MQSKISAIYTSLKYICEREKNFGLTDISVLNKTAADRPYTLEAVKKEINVCTKCQLCKSKKNYVPGEGNVNAQIMFIGEAPGFEEDEQGRPFVGEAGRLLTKIIQAMGYKREDVYIANCLKCRPPGNRNPSDLELKQCVPYLERQIELIKPKIICALGKFAAQTLLKSDQPISRLRGKLSDYNGIPLMATFHPAYLLRNPNDKKLVWEDMKQVKNYLGL